MKLINHLIFRITLFFAVVMLLWSGVYFFLQMKEIHDDNDEGLINLKQEFVVKANKIPGFVEALESFNPLNIILSEISQAEAESAIESFATTDIYFATEQEKEEVRMLTTAFRCEQNGRCYRLQLFTSTVESDDLAKNMFYLLMGLWIALSFTVLVVGKIVIAKANRPFHKLLDELGKFRIDNSQMVDLEETGIEEYRQLNESVKGLLERSASLYNEQKMFIENSSHELQTPLATAIAKLEVLLEKRQDDESLAQEVAGVLNILGRMKRLNANLLLLSKIKNSQFPAAAPVNLRDVLESVLGELEEFVAYREITVEEQGSSAPTLPMNGDLAHILLTNLVKNAISHNRQGGKIIISYAPRSIAIANSGSDSDSNKAAENVFSRYRHNAHNAKSSGLGLSIAKAIADLYRLEVTYRYDGMHTFTLNLR
ncbi:MAG: HAMP domain-containing histidine kinase [Prevotellaceae bacterium]|jgi:signal transduction histidine kinase|nr:HAMP domain-containing histidine kinase [Prevotellaceae bacterium]